MTLFDTNLPDVEFGRLQKYCYAEEKPVLVALDANVWIAERLLRSATGAAFLHAVRRMDARVLLPDVTRDEVIAEAERQGIVAVDKVNAGLRKIQSFAGSRPDVRLPTGEQFRGAAEERLNAIADLLREVVVTPDQHSRALARLHQHRPPAEFREQYRDCLLWETLVDHPCAQRVLVSADKDFVDKGSDDKLLAKALRDETEGGIAFFSTLTDYLKANETQIPPLDVEAVAAAITAAVMPLAVELAQDRGFRLGERRASKTELYATEDPSSTAAVFAITVSALGIPLPDGSEVEEANLLLAGSCFLRGKNEVTDLAMDRIDVQRLDGERLQGSVVYASGGITIGTRMVPYTVREPIPGAPA